MKEYRKIENIFKFDAKYNNVIGLNEPYNSLKNIKWLGTEKVVYEIKSLKSEVSTSGSFFLGTGHIKTEAYYFFYVEYDKGYKIEKIGTSITYINELEESNYDIPVLTNKKNKCELDDYYVIYIPRDYIIFDFNI